jgi:predicted nucleotidyltransferase
MPPELSDDRVAAICRVLIDHGVKFVIIGGMAARLHDTGTPRSTSTSAHLPTM